MSNIIYNRDNNNSEKVSLTSFYKTFSQFLRLVTYLSIAILMTRQKVIKQWPGSSYIQNV